MVDENKKAPESTTAVEDQPKPEEEQAADAADAPEAKEPIRIPRNELTAEAKAEAEKESGKPIEDIPYEVKGEEDREHAVKLLKFEVSAEAFEAHLNRFYQSLRKEVALPGYRKGKAPIRLIRIRMGKEGDRDAMSEVALNVVRQEILKREAKLGDDARIVDWEIEENQPLRFDVEIETEPEIEIAEYKGYEVEVEKLEVEDKHVEAELERMRQRLATEESAPEGKAVEPGDAIVIDQEVLGEDGKPLPHLCQENRFLSDYERELPEELAAKITGLKAGETAEAQVKNTKTNRRGEEIEFTDTWKATLREIKVQKLPELDDEFARDMEFENLAEMKAEIRKNLEEQEEKRRRNASIFKILETIVEKNQIDAPRSQIASLQYEAMMEDQYRLAQMGLRLDDVIQDASGYLKGRHETAESRAKQSLACQKLAELENLEVSEEDLEQEINRLAEETGRKPLAVRARLEAEKRLDDLRNDIKLRKVGDFLLENNKVKFVEPKPPEEEQTPDAEEKKTKPGKKSAKE